MRLVASPTRVDDHECSGSTGRRAIERKRREEACSPSASVENTIIERGDREESH